MSTNCVVSLGPMHSEIMTLARMKYPHYVREQKLSELQKKNVKSNAVVSWETQLKSSKLSKFLRQKDANDYQGDT